MKILKIYQMKEKRKHAFDIPKIFNTIIYHIQKAPISTSIKIMCLKGKYFLFTLYMIQKVHFFHKNFLIDI